MRICFIGDSFVAGVGDAAYLGWTGRVTAGLRGRGLNMTAYNLGVRRDTSADVEARWRDEAERRLRTDEEKRLVFAFGANDCALGDDGAPRIAREESVATAQRILEGAKALASTLMLGPTPIFDVEADLRIAELSGDYAEICSGLGVTYLETFGFLRECMPWREEAAAGDGVHPDRRGYTAFARYVLADPIFRAWITPWTERASVPTPPVPAA